MTFGAIRLSYCLSDTPVCSEVCILTESQETIMKIDVSIPHSGSTLAGNLYVPDGYVPGERLAGIVVSHPFGGVKEQTAGLYARQLAEQGFVALAFDAPNQGESEGLPRHLEDPYLRAEGIRAAVSYLAVREEVDPEKIAALGICAGGGNTVFTARTDRRIKAVATVSAVCVGGLFREGIGDTQTAEGLTGLLNAAAQDLTSQARGHEPTVVPIIPDSAADAEPGSMYREGYEYYRTARGQHPNSQNRFVLSAVSAIVGYDSFYLISMIAPRPLLMIAGSIADTRYFSERAIESTAGPKELFVVEGATHIDLYDKDQFVSPAITKLTQFYNRALA